MKIAVLNNCVPYVWGGAEHLAQALTEKLNEYGHEAMLFRMPFRWQPPGPATAPSTRSHRPVVGAPVDTARHGELQGPGPD